ncbi:hypothetical protein GCM10010495_26320 [Kitasatospora herbaricolor]|nr:hypothetical protein GCM10010495_26320 [Kitasatospora herbaricolor]
MAATCPATGCSAVAQPGSTISFSGRGAMRTTLSAQRGPPRRGRRPAGRGPYACPAAAVGLPGRGPYDHPGGAKDPS